MERARFCSPSFWGQAFEAKLSSPSFWTQAFVARAFEPKLLKSCPVKFWASLKVWPSLLFYPWLYYSGSLCMIKSLFLSSWSSEKAVRMMSELARAKVSLLRVRAFNPEPRLIPSPGSIWIERLAKRDRQVLPETDMGECQSVRKDWGKGFGQL